MTHYPNRYFVAHASDVAHLLNEVQKRKAARGYCWCLVDSECLVVQSMHKARQTPERESARRNKRFGAYEMRGQDLRWWITDWQTGTWASKHRTWREAELEAKRLNQANPDPATRVN